ncbi:hypothetical protein BS47DRAFT_1484123 [Hydnum rufescens UP504]|uniref:Acyltransferase MbtK/IucB-like conserved domain-containing protein n=1 Tax=Hydnum rufescens UP504 TaxID=1448309 RepID=A0A9P6B268_9AGAM|nr:hypothetical protein BS47DRAFT_1484123 [Hydnum rufescens UP504]
MDRVDPIPLLQHDAQDAPADIDLVLPDALRLRIRDAGAQPLTVHIDGTFLASFHIIDRTLITTIPGLLNDDRIHPEKIYQVNLAQSASIDGLWMALYAFWLRRTSFERLPISLDTSADQSLLDYVLSSGLGYSPPDAQEVTDFIIVRSSFWQGAGAPPHLHWLRYHTPSITPPFPHITSFTRGPNVITTHPLRPPKPPPGTVLYTRYIASNSERVNIGWRERGPDEKHRAYLAEKLADPHSMGLMVAWDGELGGYAEMSWVKEDHVNSFVGGLGEYDQGTHYLAGEDKFRGRHRFTAVMTSLKHACFLRDPRTDVVIGEPRFDLPIVPRLIAFLPQEFNREFEMPHKRAVFFVLRRERFFQAATLY